MRQIVKYPDKILREVMVPVREVDKEMEREIKELGEILMTEKEHAAGLAAVQIGIRRRMFGILDQKKNKVRIFVNPVVIEGLGEKVRPVMTFEDKSQEEFLEGCLSFPNIFGQVKRYLKIKARWQEVVTTKGGVKLLTEKKAEMEGLEAIAFQHESEHLDGVLFIDHVGEEKGKLYRFEGNKKKEIDLGEIGGSGSDQI